MCAFFRGKNSLFAHAEPADNLFVICISITKSLALILYTSWVALSRRNLHVGGSCRTQLLKRWNPLAKISSRRALLRSFQASPGFTLCARGAYKEHGFCKVSRSQNSISHLALCCFCLCCCCCCVRNYALNSRDGTLWIQIAFFA